MIEVGTRASTRDEEFQVGGARHPVRTYAEYVRTYSSTYAFGKPAHQIYEKFMFLYHSY